MKKMFEVTFTAYVMAEDPQGALDVLVDETVVSSDSGMSADIRQANSVDAGWWNLHPFGGDGQTTCGELIAERDTGE
ncbi:MAG: hypothetical protein V3R81_15385 [Gammaproteobacteria bacterium]